MKVLFIFHTAITDGGASKSGLNLVTGLKQAGIEIHSILPSDGPLRDELINRGITVDIVPFQWAYPRYYGNLKSAIKFFLNLIPNRIKNNKAVNQIVIIAKKYDVNIIHSNTSVIDVGFKAARQLKIPHITHNREFGYKDCTAVMWHIGRQMRYAESYSISITKCIKDHRKVKDNFRHRLIYNGMYPASSTIFKTEKEPYLLFVGALNRQKGILDLLEGYGRFSKGNIDTPRLKIVGDITRFNLDLQRKVLLICRRYGIAEKIDWLGKRQDIPELMSKALCIIVPSFSEAFGRVMAEAMFNGCLVLGRDAAGLREQFENGISYTGGKEIGLRFHSIEDLVIQLHNIMANPIQSFFPMIKRAQNCAVSLYSNEAYVGSTAEFYEEILNSN